jgi:hypothetical protein
MSAIDITHLLARLRATHANSRGGGSGNVGVVGTIHSVGRGGGGGSAVPTGGGSTYTGSMRPTGSPILKPEKRSVVISRNLELDYAALNVLAIARPDLIEQMYRNRITVRFPREAPCEWLNTNCQGFFATRPWGTINRAPNHQFELSFELVDDLVLFKTKFEGVDYEYVS